MNNDHDRNLGEQPLLEIMKAEEISASDLVNIEKIQLNYKMIARATKGRKLTTHTKNKILTALNSISSKKYTLKEIFNY